MKGLAIYAGTFDPLTYGHLDLIERSAELFEKVILAVAVATPKQVLFSTEERVSMARQVVRKFRNVRVESFDCMLVDFAREETIYSVIANCCKVFEEQGTVGERFGHLIDRIGVGNFANRVLT